MPEPIQIARDDPAAAFEPHRGYLRGLAYRMLSSMAEAEDAVQDAFLRALERIEQCDPERQFGPWFFRIVATTAINKVASRPH